MMTRFIDLLVVLMPLGAAHGFLSDGFRGSEVLRFATLAIVVPGGLFIVTRAITRWASRFNFIAGRLARGGIANCESAPRALRASHRGVGKMTRIGRIQTVIVSTMSLACMAPVLAQTTDDDRQDLIGIIEAIEVGWENADGAPFRRHYLDFEGARYIESGGQNEGLRDLIEHHVEPEGEALSNLDLEFFNIETHAEDNFAWAIADVELTAVVNKDQRSIHRRGHETFLFRRIGTDWKVVHTHSSSRPVTKD